MLTPLLGRADQLQAPVDDHAVHGLERYASACGGSHGTQGWKRHAQAGRVQKPPGRDRHARHIEGPEQALPAADVPLERVELLDEALTETLDAFPNGRHVG